MSLITSLIAGLLGVLIGALLTPLFTALWQRRNWQRHEAMKSYAKLFADGVSEVSVCSVLYDAICTGNEDMIKMAHQELPGLINSPLMRLVSQCWLLEKDNGIRSKIEKIKNDYKECRIGLLARHETWELSKKRGHIGEPQNKQLEKMIKRNIKEYESAPKPGEVLDLLEELKEAVAKKYFR